MLTIEQLKEYGADTATGLTRCMDNESFYLRLVGMALSDNSFQTLEDALNKGDLDAAFEAAHALKGVLGNLALDPMFKPASEMTELLRARTQTDYSPYLTQLLAEKERLQKLADA